MGGDINGAEDLGFSRSSSRRSFCFRDDVGVNGGDSNEFVTNPSLKFSSCEADRRKREKVCKEVLRSYDRLQERLGNLKAAKLKILSYTPGAWGGRANGVKLSNCDAPETTSIILVGPKGSGKSSLINRIIRMIEDDSFAPDRAQVSCGSSSEEEGTFFLQEYMISRGSPSLCLYDTRGLGRNASDYCSTIERWITKGVRHGEPVIWNSDSSRVKEMLNLKVHGHSGISSERTKINFAIFVVNAVDVLKSMEEDSSTRMSYAQMIFTAFNFPFLSFKDDKPAVVMTHGDILSLEERAQARVFLGDLLGIPPDKQIFDIPESQDASTELTICDLLRHCLEHADKNLEILPQKNSNKFEARGVIQRTIIASVMILVTIAMVMGYYRAPKCHAPEPDVPHLDWGKMRYLWFDDE